MEVVRELLSQTLLLPVHKNVCADVHAHFQRLVQPMLSAHSRQRCGIKPVVNEVCMTEVHIRGNSQRHGDVLGQSGTLHDVSPPAHILKSFAPLAQRPVGP